MLSFSTVPLRITLAVGLLLSIASIADAVFALTLRLVDAYTVPGWASIVAGITFLGGLQLLMLGVIGQYVALIHEEVKRRPLYLVRDQLDAPAASARQDREPAVAADPVGQGAGNVGGQSSGSSSPSIENTTSSGLRNSTEVDGSSSSQTTSGTKSSVIGGSPS
jgi:dolichol-phosphate mannosyltransferase